ncbi:hypothetical protein PPL_10276 [Heterostelium album PN500]|uniref:Chromatin modification-related protein MEAF6 n=1 Tax=Heterostelium pallidum (strain ATCC 26659 / Pp 5 / PN500) TaxID=670386 RepID=D3BQT8_HETP5|nr:hypothetical protein PPL_10276 [Heterostelium album PN500]EFA76508.1 hypothetical protein PPL_10276 [Heterostelium album PN500]|eukprot:XP_020428640.1 hypothetical protein PPL_10276 [Heterostelium album PN500]
MDEKSSDIDTADDIDDSGDESSSSTSTTTTTTTTNTNNNNLTSSSVNNNNDNTSQQLQTPIVKLREKSEVLAEIDSLVEEKQNIESKIASLERQIYALEGRYLEETHHIGNVIRGWDGYVSGSGALKKLRWREVDRLFSTSSVTYQNSVNDKNATDSNLKEEEEVIKRKKTTDKLKKRNG